MAFITLTGQGETILCQFCFVQSNKDHLGDISVDFDASNQLPMIYSLFIIHWRNTRVKWNSTSVIY